MVRTEVPELTSRSRIPAGCKWSVGWLGPAPGKRPCVLERRKRFPQRGVEWKRRTLDVRLVDRRHPY